MRSEASSIAKHLEKYEKEIKEKLDGKVAVSFSQNDLDTKLQKAAESNSTVKDFWRRLVGTASMVCDFGRTDVEII